MKSAVRVSLVGMVVLSFLAWPAFADVIILSTPEASGVVGVGGYSSFRIESTWTQNGSIYTYEYCLSSNESDGEGGFDPLPRDISHFIFQVSEGFDLDDIIIPDSLESSHALEEISIDDYDSTSQGNSNPGLPGTIHGIKLDLDEDTGALCISFDSFRVPVLGSFYVKGGANQNVSYAYNTYLDDPVDGLRIWTPDTQTTPVMPEPASFTLLGLGLGGMLFRRVRSRR